MPDQSAPNRTTDMDEQTTSRAVTGAASTNQPVPPEGHWYCERCKCEVSPYHVTFEETHDVRNCGSQVVWVPPLPDPPGPGSDAHLARLLGECEEEARANPSQGPLPVPFFDPSTFGTHRPTEEDADGRLREIEERAQNATEGPWHRLHDYDGAPNPNCQCGQVWSEPADWAVAYCDTQEQGEGFTKEQQMKNALFIAHARSDVPWLLSEVRRLEREMEEARRGREGEVTDLGNIERGEV